MSGDRRWDRTLSVLLHVTAAAAIAVVCLVTRSAPALTYSHVLYDDKLQNMWKDGSWKAKIDAEHDTRVYNGQYSLEVTLEGKGALCFEFEKGRDLARHYALVGWIHGGSEGGQDLRLFLTDTEGNVLPDGKSLRFNFEAYIEGGKVMPNRWQFFVIPVAHFRLGPKDISRIAFYNPSEETMPTFYLDDVGFTAQKVPAFSDKGGQPANDKPVHRDPRTAHVIYDDSPQNGWGDWSWSTKAEMNNGDNPAQGRAAAKVADQQPNDALAFGRSKGFQTAGYKALEFYIHGGQDGGQQLRVILFDVDQKEFASVSVNKADYVSNGRIAAGKWQQVYIPLRQDRHQQHRPPRHHLLRRLR